MEYGKYTVLVKTYIEALGVNYPDVDYSDDMDMAESMVCDKLLGEIMLSGDKHDCYGILKYELANHYTMCTDNYPTNMEKFMQLLNNYKSVKNKHTFD